MQFRCLDQETMHNAEIIEHEAGGRVPDDVERLLEAELLLHRVLRASRTDERELAAVETGEIHVTLPSFTGSLETRVFFLCALFREQGWRLMIAPARRTEDAVNIETKAAVPVLSAGMAVRAEVLAHLDSIVDELLEEAEKHAGDTGLRDAVS